MQGHGLTHALASDLALIPTAACHLHEKCSYLQEHGIGQDFAMYYIAYAAFSELRGNFSRAESIYQQGLER